MTDSRDGEFIELIDEGGGRCLDEFFVRGHVSQEDFDAVLRTWWDDYEGDDEPVPATDPIRHIWARWSREGSPDGDLPTVLRTYRESGPGRFKVTAAEDASVAGRHRAAERIEAEARAEVLRRWPQAMVTWASSSGDEGRASVTFRAPGVPGDVRWDMHDPGEVWVRLCDEDAWRAFERDCRKDDGRAPPAATAAPGRATVG